MHEHTEHFDWDQVYSGEVADYEEPDSDLIEIVDGLSPGRALDVGCGAGGLVVALARRGWRVTGIDVAPKGIIAARKVVESRGVEAELHVADATTWEPDDAYDLVTNSFALPIDAKGQAAVLATIRDAVAPGGLVALKDFDEGMRRHAFCAPFHLPTVEELRGSFDGWEIIRAEVVDTPAHDHGHGPVSAGRWTAVLFVARKPRA